MHIHTLKLSRFRNFEDARLEVGEAPIVALVGANGAGKTTVLEALSLLSPGAGLLGAKRDAQISAGTAPELAQWGAFFELDTPQGARTVGMSYEKNKQRQLRIDGADCVRQTELCSLGSVVWFSPKYDRLFLDAAKPRRDFLDRLVFARKGDHAEVITRYRHHLRNRQRLLKDGIRGDWLEVEETKIAAHGAQILTNRAAYLTEVKNHLQHLDINFVGSAQAVLDAPDAAAKLAEHLALNRDRDGQYGDTHFGPHRSDVMGTLTLPERTVALHQASSGQHKRAVIELLLAHARLLRAKTGQAPLVLLDEVLAHLDGTVAEQVLTELNELGSQIWLAGTTKTLFSKVCAPLVVDVAGGKLTPQPRLAKPAAKAS